MDKDKKFLIWFGLIVVLIVGAIFMSGFKKDKNFVPRNDFGSQRDYLNYIDDYKDAQKEDIYGGVTPEETLSLFIEALKKGDIVLASKYFVVDKQVEMKDRLKQGIENGGFVRLADYYSKGKIKKTYFNYSNSYRFRILKNENEPGFVIDLVFNKETNIWKIKSL